jgi:hypothetical protein
MAMLPSLTSILNKPSEPSITPNQMINKYQCVPENRSNIQTSQPLFIQPTVVFMNPMFCYPNMQRGTGFPPYNFY